MIIVGKNSTTNAEGQTTTTLHVADEFNEYYKNAGAGRNCEGQKVESIYVGNYNCEQLKPNMEIEIYFDRAVTSSKGTFQKVKKIEVLSK